jgi:hypothetical protein
MSIEGRIRNELTNDASKVDVDLEPLLSAVVIGGRRRIRVRRVAGLLAAAALVAIVIAAGPSVVDVIRHQHEQPAAPPSVTRADILGTFAVKVQPSDIRGRGQIHLEGLWQLTVRGDGLITIVPPPDAAIAPPASQYHVDGDRLITTAFASRSCSGVGEYRWSREGSSLRFTLVSDACELRVMIFTAHPWESR